MIRIIDGKPVTVPDDERITPAMKDARTTINAFLRDISADTPKNRLIRKMFLEGRMSGAPSLEWFTDPEKK